METGAAPVSNTLRIKAITMKIVMFQYNRDASAIIQENTLATTVKGDRLATNKFLANGYEDRFLWEEAASLRPKKQQEFMIFGNWQ